MADDARLVSYACRELRLTREQIAKKFGIPTDKIEAEHIRQLWVEHLRRK